MVEIRMDTSSAALMWNVSVLNREPMWLKSASVSLTAACSRVSVLNREPMWLKYITAALAAGIDGSFSAQP